MSDYSRENLPKSKRNNLALYTCEQIKRAEQLARDSGVKEIELIQKAGRGVAEFITKHFERRPVAVLCGPGSNGSDGFVVASILERAGWNVRLYCMKQVIMMGGVQAEAAALWSGDVSTLSEIVLEDDYIVVDAIFGSGLNRELSAEINETFNAIRQENVEIVAIDVPTGLRSNLEVDQYTLKADYTVTMSRPRIEHVLQPGAQFCGKIHVVDIGLPANAFSGMDIAAYLNNPDLWRKHWRIPDAETHKYKRGHVAVLGGETLTGAARLAIRGAMRSSAGVGSIYTTNTAAPIYQSTADPEVMVRGFDSSQEAADAMMRYKVNACLIGPGGHDGLSMKGVAAACAGHNIQLVLDGDALGQVSLELATVITPHEGEFSKLFPELGNVGNKLERAKKAAEIADCVIVLKGMDTIIASPDGRTNINTKASPWLSTAGSGDVLAGTVAGCLAQKIPPFEAACSAVWLHGAASLKLGHGFVASDIPKAIAMTLSEIY